MSAFDIAFKITIGHEGGYVNDPDDPGGETNYGISKRSYPDTDIASLTIGRGGKIFQEALNLSNRKELDYTNIAVDGGIGAKTISAFRRNKNKRRLYNVMNILQGEFYINLMRKNETMEKYVGWFDRVEIKRKIHGKT